jgi:hypothetical protein
VEDNRFEIDARTFAMNMKEAEFVPLRLEKDAIAERSKKRHCTGIGAPRMEKPTKQNSHSRPNSISKTSSNDQEGRSCPFVADTANTGINKRYELGDSHYQRNDFRRFQPVCANSSCINKPS